MTRERFLEKLGDQAARWNRQFCIGTEFYYYYESTFVRSTTAAWVENGKEVVVMVSSKNGKPCTVSVERLGCVNAA